MFAKWKIYFKSKMKDEEWGLTNVLLWQAVLNNFGVTEQELIEGTTKACIDPILDGWPPTTATDFIKVIRGSLRSEYPDVVTAFNLACNAAGMRGNVKRNWGHIVVRETANRIGWDRLASAKEGYISHFRRIYEQVVSEHQAGADFVIKPAKRIDPPKPINLDDDSELSKKWNQLCVQMGLRKEQTGVR